MCWRLQGAREVKLAGPSLNLGWTCGSPGGGPTVSECSLWAPPRALLGMRLVRPPSSLPRQPRGTSTPWTSSGAQNGARALGEWLVGPSRRSECRSWSPPPAGKLRMARATRRADAVGERHVGATKRPECRLWSPPAYCALRRTSSAVSHTTRSLSNARKLLESGLLAPPSGRGADCGLLRPLASCALRSSGGAAGHIILTMRMRS